MLFGGKRFELQFLISSFNTSKLVLPVSDLQLDLTKNAIYIGKVEDRRGRESWISGTRRSSPGGVESLRVRLHPGEECERRVKVLQAALKENITDRPYNWGADLVTRARSLFDVPHHENLEY